MTKIALMTDSTANLTDQQKKIWKVDVVPLSVTFGQKTFLETELTEEKFYDYLKTDSHFPTSSQPAPTAFSDAFERLIKEGYEEVIVVTISSKISGTYQCAQMMAEEYADRLKIHVVDSMSSAAEMVRLVQYTASMIASGWNSEQILFSVEAFVKRMETTIVVNELDSLARGGRLSSGVAMVGNMLKIKPLLQFDQGEIVLKEKIRTEQRAIKRVFALLEEYVERSSSDEKVLVGISEGLYRNKAEELAEEIREKHPNVDVMISSFSPVIATHLGERSLGVIWSVVDPQVSLINVE